MNAESLPPASGSLGAYLKERRARLAPAAGAAGRRRTPGLRREEVAARAGVSVTWYTWLEQGRGGPPSQDLVERLAGALELDAAGRELLFLLAQQRPPPVRRAPTPPVPPALHRVLEALGSTPAIVKTATWDVVAANAAAAAVLGPDIAPSGEPPNVLRRLFQGAEIRAALPDWEENARFAIAAFRMDAARAGDPPEASALAAELAAASPDFRRLWAEGGAQPHGAGVKRLLHPILGPLTLEALAFAVAGAEGLTMIVFTPATAADARAIEGLLAGSRAAA